AARSPGLQPRSAAPAADARRDRAGDRRWHRADHEAFSGARNYREGGTSLLRLRRDGIAMADRMERARDLGGRFAAPRTADGRRVRSVARRLEPLLLPAPGR